MSDFSDLRCVNCGASNLQIPGDAAETGSHMPMVCGDCGGVFDHIDGIYFMGGFDGDDFLGLIEVVATGEMNQTPIDIGFARHLHALLGQFHGAPDKAEFIRTHPDDMVRAPWFSDHRYHEWMQADAMLAGRDLCGKKVLNVGAGFGFDSVPLVDAGAQVTCIDYAPTIVALGKKGLPTARWVGGFSHVLPFRDESFDVVCSNAAMHHMRSTPAALREMLRVLKPGGYLFTCGDPIRPDSSDDALEFDVFNRHEGVLSGVNEGIIRFGDFFDTLDAYRDDIELAMIASVPEGTPLEGVSPVGSGVFNDFWVPAWPQNVAILRELHGAGLCVAVTKLRSIAIPAATQSQFLLPAGILASWINHPDTAFSRLMAWAPEKLVNLPFPDQQQNWFSLLNGWMAPVAPYASRTGFQRARWLLRSPGADRLAFSARMVEGERELEVHLNGRKIHTAPLTGDWGEVVVPFPVRADSTPFLVELRIAGDTAGLSFDARSFEVKERTLA